MDKLITTDLNGFPFVLDDLRFIDNGIREAFKGIHSALLYNATTPDAFLYAPVKATSFSNVVIGDTTPPLYANIGGEIYYIPPTGLVLSGNFTGDCYVVEPDISYDSAGLKVFEDAVSHNTYQKRRARLVKKSYSTIDNATETAVLFWEAGDDGWKYVPLNTYFGRFLNINGLFDADVSLAFMEGQITNLQASRDNAEGTWVNVPMSTLMRTTNPVFYRATTSDPTTPTTWTPIPTDSTIDASNSFLKIKRIGKTIHLNIYIKDLLLQGYPTAFVNGLFIDLNNLGISGLSGGVVQNFVGNLSGNSGLLSTSDRIEAIKSNGNLASGKNGIFLRLKNGSTKTYLQWNINHYIQVQTIGAYSNVAKNSLIGDFDVYPSSASWDIKGTLTFEMY